MNFGMVMTPAAIRCAGLHGKGSSAARALLLLVVAGAHGALIAALLQLRHASPDLQRSERVSVRLIEAPPPAAVPAPVMAPPIAPPSRPPRPVAPVRPRAPQPHRAVRAPAPQPLSAAVPRSTAVAAPAAAPATAARFDADYLNNPPPVYPPLSLRKREQGRVVLRVRVSAQGTAERIAIHTGSGHVRLDGAAQAAVARWRFVPASRDGRAVAADALVPIVFRLDAR